MSEIEEPQPPKSSRKPVQPLPRLWKTEPDSEELAGLPPAKDSSGKKSSKEKDDAPSGPAVQSRSKGKSKSGKDKSTPAGDEKTEKKVLKEDTPALDTYESRRRARMLVGGLTVACVLLFGWIIYTGFIYDPTPVMGSEDPLTATSVPEPKPSFDREAQLMFDRARGFDKNGKTNQAIDMLNILIKVKNYKDTPTALAAKTALDRHSQNLPLFADGPIVLAAPEEAKPAPIPPAPPTVVAVKPNPSDPAGGQASLVLPANPSEALVLPPSSAPSRTTTAGTASRTRALPPGFQANLQAGVHQSGWPFVIVGDRDGAPMVLVPAGTFTMGNDDGQPPERPAHQVQLSTYYIDEHEVTNRQFRIFLAESRYKGQPAGKWLSEEKAREPETMPVTYVSFPDANAFAGWAGKEIPTEAQWEIAARSGDGRRFPWGNEPLAKSRARNLHQIDPVMSFPDDVSPYRVFDMAGNVQEWTRDWYDSKYYHQFAKSIADNPAGPNTRSGSQQVAIRGGAKNWSVTAREGARRDSRLAYLGFRCVLVVDGPTAAGTSANPSAPARPGTPPRNAPDAAAVPF
jgi:sulfatase modifying factor 1